MAEGNSAQGLRVYDQKDRLTEEFIPVEGAQAGKVDLSLPVQFTIQVMGHRLRKFAELRINSIRHFG